MTQQNRETLLALADRVEKAAGPDRELDAAIVRALVTDGAFPHRDPAFTASLDAAISLYPVLPERIPSNSRHAAAEALRATASSLEVVK